MTKQKKQPIVQRSCNQCSRNMENSAEVMAGNGNPAYIGICCNPACPSFALLQIAAEQMPKEDIDLDDTRRRLSHMKAFLKKNKESK